MPQLLDPIEQSLVRAWIKGVPLDALTEELPPDRNDPNTVHELKQRLTLKAKRLEMPWQRFFLGTRQETAHWEKLALEHLHWLIEQPDIDPCIDHPVEYWIDDAWLPSMHDSNLTTMRHWLTWRQTQGNDWWRHMPGIGQKSAKILDKRLRELFPDAATALPALLLPTIVYQTDLAPLSHFVVPKECDGSNGTFRGIDECFISADNDLQAIQCWLARLDPKSHTHRAYQREAERLLLWAIIQKHKALSSLDTVDLADYRRFMENPQPAERWVGENRRQTSSGWKPFTGPLSPRSIRHADTILGHLFHFLLGQGYLRYNPFTALPKLRNPAGHARMDVNRSLSPKQWAFVTDYITQKINAYEGIEKCRWLRLQLIARLLYATGLRSHELAKATLGDIFSVDRDGTPQIWLKVVGKGNKKRDVPLPTNMHQLIQDTFTHLSKTNWNQRQLTHPIIMPLRQPTQSCLTPKAIYVELKYLFQQVSESLADSDPESANKLSIASTHWLRHTHGTVAVNKNIPITMIRDNLGHASIATTSQYLHSDEDSRHTAFCNL